MPARSIPSTNARERLLKRSVKALTDAEFAAVWLNTGTSRASALEIAPTVMAAFSGLAGMNSAPLAALSRLHGVGPARAAQLRAGVEIARHAAHQALERRNALSSPEAVRSYLRQVFASRQMEVYVGLFFDSQHRMAAADELFQGMLAQTSAYPREVVKAAPAYNAAAVILAHNHPSGVAEPSRADEMLTQSLRQALALVDIRTLDHFVVVGADAISFAERGTAITPVGTITA